MTEPKSESRQPSNSDLGVVRSKALQRGRVIFLSLVLVVSTVGTAAGVVRWVAGGIHLAELALFLIFYVATMLGVEVGYHRLGAHRAFGGPKVVRGVLGVMGSMAGQGPLLYWSANHRRHHKYSDESGDPHSPGPAGGKPSLRGLLHAHVGWIFDEETTNSGRWAPDLLKDPLTMWLHQTYVLWLALGLALPTGIGFLIGGADGALGAFVWGGCARMFLVNNIVWGINSIGHTWGSQPFRAGDGSRNNVVLAVLGLGAGWHNNHHAFPSAATTKVDAWHVDPCHWVLRGLEMVGLVDGLQRVEPELVQRKRVAVPVRSGQ
jgi:stearoyl-CoA desaturase (Delta-9 desaturase)